MLATKYTGRANPVIAKKKRAVVSHVAAPLNGLSLATNYAATDSQYATILKNFNVEDDRIQVRAGYVKRATRGTASIWCLVPYYGPTPALLAASNHELWNAQSGTLVKAGFTSDDWHWSAFSNLSHQDFTVMVNGTDGVWSWNGALVPGVDPSPVTVTSLNHGSPITFTVAAPDFGKFQNGMTVVIAGATGGLAAANGSHVIAPVLTPANTWALTGVSGGTAPQITGVTADPPALQPIIKENVTANAADSFIDPNTFNIVLAHQNRLFFADRTNLAVYYLPLMQKSGEVKYLPLNAVFRRGGSIRAMFSWTQGGADMTDQLVIFSTNGECVIYSGADPDTDFALTGIYRFDAPMSKHSVVNYGGELYVLISTGLVPMSTLMQAETDHLGNNDRNVISLFLKDAINYRDRNGWEAFLNPSTGRLFCNIPQGAANRYKQFVRHMPKEKWTTWEDIPARCWGWIDPFVYFGDDSGNVYEMHPVHVSDNGLPITVDVQTAWSQFKTPAKKHFLAIKSYMTTDGSPHPVIDVKVDYDYSPGINVPLLTDQLGGAEWDVSIWGDDPAAGPDDTYWEGGERVYRVWNGVAPSGVVGAVRLTARIYNCGFSVTGWDVIFEEGKFGPP